MKLLTAVLLALPALAFAQGALTPPGAPAPSMKTLDQIEARTPLGAVGGSSATIAIFQPGSYVLLGNLAVTSGDGISIYADNVTLDLGGFTISSSTGPSPAGEVAIRLVSNRQNIIVRNGHIRGSVIVNPTTGSVSGNGFLHGVFSYQSVQNAHVSDLTVSGVASNGIALDAGSAVDHCVVTNCGGLGIWSQVVANCSATSCGFVGIRGNTVSNSQGSATSSGIEASSAINCVGTATGTTSGSGLKADTASNCSGSSTNGPGLWATRSATGCYGSTIGVNAHGLQVVSEDSIPASGPAENCQGTTTGSGLGLYAGTATNCTGTSVSGMGLQADMATGCKGATTTGVRGLYIIGTASNCRGKNPSSGGVALSATIAVACTAESGTILVSYRYNMP